MIYYVNSNNLILTKGLLWKILTSIIILNVAQIVTNNFFDILD